MTRKDFQGCASEKEWAEASRPPTTEEVVHTAACDAREGLFTCRCAEGPPASGDALREVGDGYEIRTWVKHEPSGVVVLKGHPQLGGRYCLTDGGDWPCAAVRNALAATPPERSGLPSETDLDVASDLLFKVAHGKTLGPTSRELARRLAHRLSGQDAPDMNTPVARLSSGGEDTPNVR